MLTYFPSEMDVRHVVFYLDPSSALGPDEFPSYFFQKWWSIVGPDVVKAIQYFFLSGELHPGINSKFMVFIPKSLYANMVDGFRPTMLGNFLYKIVTKIIANRVANITLKFLSHNQFGLIKGRHIEECIATASKCVNLLDRKCFRGMLLLKLILEKLSILYCALSWWKC